MTRVSQLGPERIANALKVACPPVFTEPNMTPISPRPRQQRMTMSLWSSPRNLSGQPTSFQLRLQLAPLQLPRT